MNRVGGVPRLGLEPFEDSCRALPRGLFLEEDGDFFGGERGGEGGEGSFQVGGGGEGAEEGGEGAAVGFFLFLFSVWGEGEGVGVEREKRGRDTWRVVERGEGKREGFGEEGGVGEEGRRRRRGGF